MSTCFQGLVVPGGGLTVEGRPHPFVISRLEEAARLYHAQRGTAATAPKVFVLSCGTTHKPPPHDHAGFPITEAAASARVLIEEHGLPADDLLEEGLSLDTIGNAYLLRVIHTDVAGISSLAVITNSFHLPRTRAIFEKVFSLPRHPSPPEGGGEEEEQQYKLTFVEVPDVGMDDQAAEARRAKEAQAIESFRANTADVRCLPDLHRFLFTRHMAYATKRLTTPRAPIDPAALKTY